MKKFWKVLGLTALAAAVIPYRVRRDEEANTTSIDALLWQLSRGPGEDENHDQVDLSLGFKSPFQAAREEKALFTDHPEEAVLFADDDPAAAVVEPGPEEEKTEEAPAPEEATEEDFDPEG